MRNRSGNLIVGVVLILFGIGWAGNSLDLWNFNFFFNGWWTLFIIIPCLFSALQHGFNTGNIFGIAIGLALLASAQNIISWETIGALIFPAVLVGIGISMLFRDLIGKQARISASVGKDGLPEYSATFSTQQIDLQNECFHGACINAIFGSVDLNLKNAVIDRDIVIHATATFGGIKIIIPPNVKVKVSSIPIFGGVSTRSSFSSAQNCPVIYLNGTCMFGGIEVL